MPLDAASRDRLRSLVDEVLPADAHQPGGWAGGVEAFVDAEWDGLLRWAQDPVAAATETGDGFESLDRSTRQAIVRITHEGFYGGGAAGGAAPAGWGLVLSLIHI